MNRNFIENGLAIKCASILGVSVEDMSKILEIDKDASLFVRRRLAFGIKNIDENIGYVLKQLLCRNVDDFSKIRKCEIEHVKQKYGIDVNLITAKKSVILSEKVDPLVLGIIGETVLREYAKVLGISRKDAIKLVKSNESVKLFLHRERSLSILDRKNCVSVLLQNTLGREKGDFSAINKLELSTIYSKYGILIDAMVYSGKQKALSV